MHDCAITYDREDYEKELRKLVCCEDEPGHPVTPYGRERERIRKLLQSSDKNLSKFFFSYSDRSSLLLYDSEQSEFMLYDSENEQQTSLFYEPSQSEFLLQYMVDEIYYRALELIALRHFDEARKALGYKGDTDGRVYEMYLRIREKNTDKWLPDMPGLWKKKDQLAIADEISLTISHYALFLFFGAMQKMHVPGILERLLDSLSEQGSLEREVERIFPEQGYTILGISHAWLFAQAYEKFLKHTSRISSNPQYPYMPDMWIINPRTRIIGQEDINFYKLTTDTTQLRACLERCLKRNGAKYAEEAIKQWKIGEAAYANRCAETPQADGQRQDTDNGQSPKTEDETECLRDELKRVEAEAEVLRNEVRERNGEIKRLRRELKAQSQECVQTIKEEKEHVQNLQALISAQKKQTDTAVKEKDKQIARLENELKTKERKMAEVVNECNSLRESRQKEKPFPKETEQLLKREIQSLKKERRMLKEEIKSLKGKIDVLSEQALPDAGSEVLDQIISSLHHYENDLYDNGLVQDWVQTEKLLMHIFNDVPNMMKAIRQMHNDRSRLVKEQKKKERKQKEHDPPTVFINENNGPILANHTDHGNHTSKKLLKPTDE